MPEAPPLPPPPSGPARGRIARWLDRVDPERYSLHRAVRVALAPTLGVAIGTVVFHNSELTLFASFGGIAVLLFADFPGRASAQLAAFAGLFLVGAVLITVGTLVSPSVPLSTVGMLVVGFLALFSGIVSAAMAGGARAVLLAFILPVCFVGGPADIPSRLLGWLIAFALAVPAALLLWPPRDHDALRTNSAAACRALADRLTELLAGREPDRGPARAAVDALRAGFVAGATKPVTVTAGSRVLVRVVDQTRWLEGTSAAVTSAAAASWPPLVRDATADGAAVLSACADLLGTGARPTAEPRQRLSQARRDLDQTRGRVADSLVTTLRAGPTEPGVERAAAAGAFGELRPAGSHEIAYASQLIGHTVGVSAAQDARPILDRLFGRPAESDDDGPLLAAGHMFARHLTVRSVWFRNSVRGTLGLTLAVFVAQITQVQHGFWVVLGAMAVLRTSAVNTGATALRALGGTVLGFAVGAALMVLTGFDPVALWILLPIGFFFAGFAPQAIGFAAGQAAFTVAVVVLFNLLAPSGWGVGLIRIEDVAIGCAAALIVGVLAWPRGAAAEIREALASAVRGAGAAFRVALDTIADSGGPAVDGAIEAARAAATRLDDATRQYLAERGSRPLMLHDLVRVTNGAALVRLTAEALQAGPPPPIAGTAATEPARSPELLLMAAALRDSAQRTASWYSAAADGLDGAGPGSDLLTPLPADAERRVVGLVAAHPAAVHEPAAAERARELWWASLYVDDLARLQGRIAGAVLAVTDPSAAAGGTPMPATAG